MKYAMALPNSQPGPVPEWAKRARSYLDPMIIGPPPSFTEDEIGSIEMLCGVEDGYPQFYGYVHITAEDAQALADAGGGYVEIGSMTKVLNPWSAMLYRHHEPGEGVIYEGLTAEAEEE